MAQAVEVQLLSWAPRRWRGKLFTKSKKLKGRLAQLVRALRLHRRCRGFESLSVHFRGFWLSTRNEM